MKIDKYTYRLFKAANAEFTREPIRRRFVELRDCEGRSVCVGGGSAVSVLGYGGHNIPWVSFSIGTRQVILMLEKR